MRPREDDRGERPEDRNEAFLVGKVSGIEFVERQNDRDRYLIKFSEYAEVSVPSFREASTRNPVVYHDLAECRRRDLDIEALEFHRAPAPTQHYERHDRGKTQPAPSIGRRGLTIADAKDGLAVYFDVPIDAIQITING